MLGLVKSIIWASVLIVLMIVFMIVLVLIFMTVAMILVANFSPLFAFFLHFLLRGNKSILLLFHCLEFENMLEIFFLELLKSLALRKFRLIIAHPIN